MKKCEYERLCSLLRIDFSPEEYLSFSNYILNILKNEGELSLISNLNIHENKLRHFSSLRQDETFPSVDTASVLSSSKNSDGVFFRLKEGGNKT